MTQSRRDVLEKYSVDKTTNAGLWLDKYLKDSDNKEKNDEAKKNLVQEAALIQISEAYKKFYQKWKTELSARGIQMKEAATLGRLAVNLGAEAVLENSIALNRTYGAPYIPGSALKGLAASYARKFVENFDVEIQNDIFGTQENAGWVTFFDALFVPKGKLGLVTDVVTVHHQEYYQTDKDKDVPPPADWDSPIPIHFLSAVGSFSIALAGPDNLVQAAYDILALALAHEGIGAKTNSGYGRMQIDGYDVNGLPKEEKESAKPQEIPAGYQGGVVKNVKDRTYASQKKQLLQETPLAGRLRGTVSDVREGRYGKVNPAQGGKTVRIHINQITKGEKSLRDGQIVEYRIGKYQGNDQAEEVVVLLNPES
jgi:CRISPR-associated protein Cmr6